MKRSLEALKIDPEIRTQVLELNVAGNVTTSYNFGQQPTLRQAQKITRIEAFDASQVTLSPGGKTVVSNGILKKSYLKLVELGGSQQILHTIPLYDLSQQQNAMLVEDINCLPIDWEKSEIIIPETTGLNANESFLFKVEFIKG